VLGAAAALRSVPPPEQGGSSLVPRLLDDVGQAWFGLCDVLCVVRSTPLASRHAPRAMSRRPPSLLA